MSAVFLSGWFDSYDCAGPPSVMYTFPESNPPLIYQPIAADNPIPVCGSSYIPIPVGCCISSLDLDYTLGYQSITRNYIDSPLPTSADWYQYCALEVISNSAPLNQKMYFLDNGQCSGGGICEGGVLAVFNSSDCTGYRETFGVGNQLSNIYGNVTVAAENITGANLEIKWIGYTPQALLVPTYKSPIEQFALGLFIISVLMGLFTFLHYLVLFTKNKKFKELLFAIAQFLTTADTLIQCVYWNTMFANDDVFNYLSITVKLLNLQQLFSVYVHLYIIFTIYPEYRKTIVERLVYIIFTVIYASTMFYGVAAIIDLSTNNSYYSPTDVQLQSIQAQAGTIWYSIYIIIQLIPSLLILVKIKTAKAQKHSVQKQFTLLVLLANAQMLVMILSIVFNIVGEHTLVYKSDRVYLAMDSVNNFLIMLNSVLSIWLYQKLVSITKLLTRGK
ncbi:hypothetical protein HDV01_001675 [Terramyces sp. JEL0728]|nr:hypothetical protein HDV01_001675 [Terramyces sp. JEL0728]